MPASDIVIKGAREHNLCSVDLVLPRNQLICLTGVSGSGKSSLAFDTLYAEGQRRYVESLSSFARQFLGQLPKPDVDHISGLSPSISIAQKSAGNNPRSTVGTITEIYDYLRVLYARVGQGYCPRCQDPITAQSREQVLAQILQLPKGTRFTVLAPVISSQKGEHRDLFADLLKQGFSRARVDGQVYQLAEVPTLDRRMRHDIDVVVDRLEIKNNLRPRLAEAVDLALKTGQGILVISVENPANEITAKSTRKTARRATQADSSANTDQIFSVHYACNKCQVSFATPTPQLFSFNSPQGMCKECDGLGQLFSFDADLLVPDPSLSFKQGCFELLGKWKKLGRWRRHIYQGVADTVEPSRNWDAGYLLETAWQDLESAAQDVWLWGAGEQHITFTWRSGSSPMKYGGEFQGIVPDLMSRYRASKSRPQRRQLERYMRTIVCPECSGQRLVKQARAVTIRSAVERFADNPQRSLPEICQLSVHEALNFFDQLDFSETEAIIADEAVREIRGRLGFLVNVGLDYLTLDRTAPTLSGGESQRIRLAAQLGSGLVGVLYILDEPSIGLHARDNQQLLGTLQRLRDQGNTVVVVEHDEETMRAADHLIDFGPGPGVRGGEVVASGSIDDVMKSTASVTGQYLASKREIAVPTQRRQPGEDWLQIRDAAHNNLRNQDVAIPLGTFTCVTGVSGSGKSSLVNDILVEALRRDLNQGVGNPGTHAAMEGLHLLDKMIAIDQSPIGRTPRSNPATYIKVFDDIRQLFARLPEAKRRGFGPGRFSFNVDQGRCEACNGNGTNRLEMDFLADVWVTCPICQGRRFNRETLQVKFKDYTISDVLEMDIQQALELFENVPKVHHKLQTLRDVGLDYIKLGQPSPTLSGGEAQRIKLARELTKKSTGQTIYVLDEPTTGLHFADIQLLLKVLHGFVEAGNTVLVVEHNIDVIKTADWIIDLGPEGGAGGGTLVAVGTPEEVAEETASYTGQALRPVLGLPARKSVATAARKTRKAKGTSRTRSSAGTQMIRVRGAQQHNLKMVDAEITRDEMTVFCGPSGSGKSSLAMDTIYAEGQRRYVESLSAYARQFINQMQKPRLEHIEGLSPAIAIEQKNLGNTPRSTVGTVTEIYDYLRILMARLGTPHCPACNVPVGMQTVDEIVDKVLAEPAGTRLYLMAPLDLDQVSRVELLWEEMLAAGYIRVRLDGETYSLDEAPEVDRRRQHRVEVIVDRVKIGPRSRSRVADSIENALELGNGLLYVAYVNDDLKESRWEVKVHSQFLACDSCGLSLEQLTPHNFSFNSHLGWCTSCEGLGTQTGANPAALIRDPKATLAGGALDLWPDLQHPVAERMLQALAKDVGLPLDVPLDQIDARQRRLLMHGTGDQWFTVYQDASKGKRAKPKPMFRFQFKGLYPALEEASRLSPALRAKLEHLVDEVECSSCGGSRLREDAASVRFFGRSMDELCRQPLESLQETVEQWDLDAREQKIAGELIREIRSRLQFLNDIGLHYLSLSRPAATLSNGEAQRIRLASQLGSGLCGVLYVLDEPTIGLHPRDSQRLIEALQKLRDLGNTLLVVEHDRELIAASDRLCDFGPAAGRHGGEIVARGTPEQVAKRRKSVTGPYLSGKKSISIPTNRRLAGEKEPLSGQWLEVLGARHHNLQNIDLRIPLGTLTAITGPSGSGKSSLIDEVLYAALARRLHRAKAIPGLHDRITGLEFINKVIRVDQNPLGNSPTSNPATYTGMFDLIRSLFAQLPEAKLRGFTPRRFSFNVAGGRCDACDGNGQQCVEMHFLPDVWIRCDVCQGKRYNPETLAVTYRGRSISDILDLTCQEAVLLFENIPKIRRIVQTLCDVGLDYLTLGQAAPTLSGGEAQRVKLAAELARPDTGQTLYLLDEPTTGLHFDDLAKLLEVIHRLVDLGNTVVVIEHNLDIIKAADWLVDLGPEAGAEGGQVVAAGTPEQVVAAMPAVGSRKRKSKKPSSHTAVALAPVLASGPYAERVVFDPSVLDEKQEGDLEIQEVGKETSMPWEADGRLWHTQSRVDRKGQACRWDGEILGQVVDRIQQLGEFSETDWSARSVVEIAATKKSTGWFFHAITGETWLLKMKFRVARGTFQRTELVEKMPLKTLNQMDELPVYGNNPRVKVKTLRGPWQEVQVHAHSWEEIDTPAFWDFLEQAVKGFRKITQRAQEDPKQWMPWKKLGQKWHFMRKGFPPGKSVLWKAEVLEELFEILVDLLPEGQFLWNNQSRVHLYDQGGRDPWATIMTKRSEDVTLLLRGPSGRVPLGRLAGLGRDRSLDKDTASGSDIVKLSFRTLEDLHKGNLSQLLQEHLAAVREQSKR